MQLPAETRAAMQRVVVYIVLVWAITVAVAAGIITVIATLGALVWLIQDYGSPVPATLLAGVAFGIGISLGAVVAVFGLRGTVAALASPPSAIRPARPADPHQT